MKMLVPTLALTIVALTIVALTVGALRGPLLPQSSAAQGGPTIAVDADPSGNGPRSVASIESCTSVKSGDTFQIDLVITDVSDLLAWETYVHYDPAVIQVTARDVQQMLSTEGEEAIFDTSASVPNEDGRYRVGGANIAERTAGVSGNGVLAQLTMKAVDKGVTSVEIDAVDLTDDDKPDIGPTLADIDGNRIGDSDGDSFFDGLVVGAEVAVDTQCAEFSSTPLASPVANSSSSGADDDGADWWIFVVIAVVAVVTVAAVGVAVWLVRARGQSAGGG